MSRSNIVSDKLHRWRPFVIFGFGLLHGLGFASVLGEFGLPDGQVIPALIGFNIGVELGQLTVIAIAFILVWYAIRVDRGEADVAPAQGLYGVLAVIFAGLGIAMNTPGFQEVMGASAMIFFWPLTALSVLCGVSNLVDQLDSIAATSRSRPRRRLRWSVPTGSWSGCFSDQGTPVRTGLHPTQPSLCARH